MSAIEELEQRFNALQEQVTTLTSASADAEKRLKKAEREAVPVGTIQEYAGRYDERLAADGWLPCEGSPLSGDEYPELFLAIGQLWGKGNGGERDFNLPPLGGLFLRGATSNPRLADLEGRTSLGTGSATEVGSVQGDSTRLPNKNFENEFHEGHRHRDPTWNGAGGTTYELATVGRAVGGFDYGEGAPTELGGQHTHVISGGDAETRPKNAYVTHIIKAGRRVPTN